jgi:hypothetical protein
MILQELLDFTNRSLLGEVIEDAILIDLFNRAQEDLLDVLLEPAIHDIETAAGTASYDLPGNFHRFETVLYDDQSLQGFLSLGQLARRYRGDLDEQGTPAHYYRDGTQITLVPVPDAAKTLRLIYVARPSVLSDDDLNASPEFDETDHKLLAYYAAWQIRSGRDEDPRAGGLYRDMYLTGKGQLWERTALRQHTRYPRTLDRMIRTRGRHRRVPDDLDKWASTEG